MRSPLSRRLDRIEAQAAPKQQAARYVVDSFKDYHRVREAFVSPRPPPPPGDTAAPEPLRSDASLPPEERYTYHEAVAAGVVFETEAFRAARWEAERKGARQHYGYLRRMIDPYPHIRAGRDGPNVRGYSYAVQARRPPSVSAAGPMASPAALKSEADCEDALHCLAWAEAFEAEHGDAEALLAAYREERKQAEGARQEEMRRQRAAQEGK